MLPLLPFRPVPKIPLQHLAALSLLSPQGRRRAGQRGRRDADGWGKSHLPPSFRVLILL
jgi:hypothetical protein